MYAIYEQDSVFEIIPKVKIHDGNNIFNRIFSLYLSQLMYICFIIIVKALTNLTYSD